MQRSCDQTFAGSVFARCKNVGVRGRHPRNDFHDRAHGHRFGDNVWSVTAQQLIFRLQFATTTQGTSQLDLRAHNCYQTLVVPGFRNKVARPPLHRLHRQIDRRPRRHHHDRERVVDLLDFGNDFKSFLPGSGVARVIEIHHQQRVIFFLECVENSRQGGDRIGLVPFPFQQNAQRFEHIALIVGDKNSFH